MPSSWKPHRQRQRGGRLPGSPEVSKVWVDMAAGAGDFHSMAVPQWRGAGPPGVQEAADGRAALMDSVRVDSVRTGPGAKSKTCLGTPGCGAEPATAPSSQRLSNTSSKHAYK